MITPRLKVSALIVFAIAAGALPSYVHAAADTSSDTECKPITTTKCGCGQVFNEKTGWCDKGDNKYRCICSQTDAGVVTTGTCQADGVCKAVSTGGKTPQLPSPQVQPGIGGLQPNQPPPDVTQGTSPTLQPQEIPANPAVGPTSLPAPGQSIFQDALQQLQSMAGNGGQGSPGAGQNAFQQESGVPLWLSGGQAYQLTQPETPSTNPSAPANSYSDFPQSTGSFLGVSDKFGPTLGEASYANTLVTQTPAEQAAQAIQDIQKGVADTAGSWADGALKYLDQQSANLPQNQQQDFLTTYGVCYQSGGCNAIQGAPTTYSEHPDANGVMNHDIYTLDGYGRGDYPYVTVAGPRDQQGNTGVIPEITYTDPFSGQTQTLKNVPYMVADTGSSTYFPSGNSNVSATGGNHFDVPIDIPPDAYPSVTGSVAQMNSYTVAQPFSGSVASVVPTDNLQQSYALNDPWSNPASGGLPAYAMQQSTAYPQADIGWAQSVPEAQLASLQSTPQIASDLGVPGAENAPGNLAESTAGGSQIPPPEMVQTNPQQSFEQAIASQIPTPEQVSTNPQQAIEQAIASQIPVPGQEQTNPQQSIESSIAAQIPTPEQVQVNPQSAIETAIAQDNASLENALLQDRLALADVQTNAFNNPVMPPVNTELPSGQALTQQIYDNAIASAGANVPVPAAAEVQIPTQAQMQASLLADQGKSFSALDANSFYYNVQGTQFAESGPANPAAAVEQGPTLEQPNPTEAVTSAQLPLSEQQIAAQIPTPEPVVTNPQQSIEATNAQEAAFAAQVENAGLVARQDLADAQTAAYQQALLDAPSKIPTPEVFTQSGEALTQQIAQAAANEAQPLAEVTNAERTFTAIDPYANAVTAASNGTNVSSELFAPDALRLGAASYNPAVADATQFKLGSTDQPVSPIENPPLPAPRPPEAGPLGIDIKGGCGGVCEFNNTGADVTAIQKFLKTQGYDINADGIYGSKTESAVSSFQEANKIGVDGVVGPETLAKMNEIAAQNPNTPQETPQQQPATENPQTSNQPSQETQQKQETPQQPAGQSPQQQPQKPELTPMQKEAQRVQNAFNASYGAYKAFMSNPTDQTLAKLMKSVQNTQAVGSQFGDTTVQNVASKLGGMQQASGYNPSFVATMLGSYQSSIIGGFKTVQQALGKYLH